MAAREYEYKSLCAVYLTPARDNAAMLHKRLEPEVRRGLRATLNGILYHPQLVENHTQCVYFTKYPLFE